MDWDACDENPSDQPPMAHELAGQLEDDLRREGQWVGRGDGKMTACGTCPNGMVDGGVSCVAIQPGVDSDVSRIEQIEDLQDDVIRKVVQVGSGGTGNVLSPHLEGDMVCDRGIVKWNGIVGDETRR